MLLHVTKCAMWRLYIASIKNEQHLELIYDIQNCMSDHWSFQDIVFISDDVEHSGKPLHRALGHL